MEIEYSKHWEGKQKEEKKDITEDTIEFAIKTSPMLKDKYWRDALNAIARIPPSGRSIYNYSLLV